MRNVFQVSCHSERSQRIFFLFSFFFFLFFCSCGSKEESTKNISWNDSLPSDIRAINAKINRDRNNPDLYFQRAKARFDHRDFETAIGDVKIALKIDSLKSNYYIFLSDLYFTQNRTRDTRDALRKAMALDSSNAEALMKYSQLFYLLRKYDTAIFFINRSLHYDRASAVANFQKGMILKEAGDTAKAISCFQSAVELNQQYFDAYMQLGILLSVKNNPLTLGYLDNALNINPNSIEAHYAKGKFLQNVRDYENALKVYDALLTLAPENQDALFNVGAIFYEQKKYEDAIQKFKTTIIRDVNFYRGYYGRGRCYEALGQRQKAIDDYKNCLAIKPDYELASVQLDVILKRKH